MSAKSDPMLTGPEAAQRCGVTAGTWRGYVHRKVAPAPDDPDEGRPVNRRQPRWKTSTVDYFKENRIGQGRRPTMHLAYQHIQGSVPDCSGCQTYLRDHGRGART